MLRASLKLNVPWIAVVGIVLSSMLYLGMDSYASYRAEQIIQQQVEKGLGLAVTADNTKLSSSTGQFEFETVVFVDIAENIIPFTAREVELDVSVAGLLRREILVDRAEVRGAEVNVVYSEPGHNNIRDIQERLNIYLTNRRVSGKELVEWDLKALSLFDTRLKVWSPEKQLLADVVVPQVSIPMLSSALGGVENKARVLEAIRMALLKQVVLGRAEGRYDVAGIKKLAVQELSVSWKSLASHQNLEKFKQKGAALLESFSK